MTTTHEVVEDLVLSDSTENVVINAPVEKIHLGKWLTQLTDAEYQACAVPDHRACGWSKNADGDLVSINVEVIGGALMIQHYVAEVLEPHHCRLVSLSETQSPDGWQYVQVIWDLSVTPLDSGRATFTNKVLGRPTRSFLENLKERGIPFEQVVEERQAAVARHNALEAPHYAASVERVCTVS
ncbi:hypothetical protein EDD90_10622 [Streptomyces sp. Ag109_O5-1]|uniref:hypothetical protein n=1 Tax=Streptomyces TaxID=1883 RepID=UPI000F500F91|nr:hypothetical protein [Streptomyces sp. Ag109_O5-1]RPE47175.1 hypothetical protein EDD90_10622 [Streptomyces sp. Ag109_O5-1]